MTKTLMQEPELVNDTGCCPRFDARTLDHKEVTWTEKLFVEGRVASFMHIPLNFGKVMTRIQSAIESAGAKIVENLVLSNEKSSWGTDLLFAVDKEVPGLPMTRISGTFVVRVFEGEYRDMGRIIHKMQEYLRSQNQNAAQWFFYYPYCPKCAKAYGKNYIVIFAQIA